MAPKDKEKTLVDKVKSTFRDDIIETKVFRGEVTHLVEKRALKSICNFLYSDPDLRMNYLVDVLGAQRIGMDAAWINGTAAHALDLDDVSQRGEHPSAVMVPAILAEAETMGASGEQMVTAYAAGYETCAELVRRDPDYHHNKGWHPTGIFGAIAAANALSDIYAMGGKPFLALNITMLPNDLPPEIGAAILRGGAEKAKEAGVVVAGGHTLQDKEPKYGLVAIGFVDPRKAISKQGAHPGDLLFLTKPLGFGVTNTAVKRELASLDEASEVVVWMKRLNKTAAELAQEFELRGGTDVTGFGLLGHGWEMAQGAGVRLRIQFHAVPFTSAARKYAEVGAFPGGSLDNRAFYSPHVLFTGMFEDWEQTLLFDAQTSGGLLLAVPAAKAAAFAARAAELKLPIWKIGEVLDGEGIDVVK